MLVKAQGEESKVKGHGMLGQGHIMLGQRSASARNDSDSL